MKNLRNIISEILLKETSFKVSDLSGMSTMKGKGKPLKNDKYFVLHHTGGEGSAQSVMGVLNSRKGGLGIQYIIDKQGNLYNGLPPGTRGKHVDSTKRSGGGPKDLSNSTSQGVEIIAADDTKINLNQCKTALILVKSLGYSLGNVYAHGEIQTNKMPSEGATCKRYFQKYWNTPQDNLPIQDSNISSLRGTKSEPIQKPKEDEKNRPIQKPKEDEKSNNNPKINPSLASISQSFYSGQAKINIDLILKKLKERNITDPTVVLAILGTIGKESGFNPKGEMGYCNTDDSRIVKIFSDRGRKCKSFKCDDEKFFECVYGKDSGAKLGNTQPGDGYKYRGRGFHGLTGRANYRKYGYESNPEALLDPNVSIGIALDFLTKEGSQLNNKFKNIDEAIKFFVTRNAGGATSSMGESKAKEVISRFKVSDQPSTDYLSASEVGTSDEETSNVETSGSDFFDQTKTNDNDKLDLIDMFGLGGLKSYISLIRGDEEQFKKDIAKDSSLTEQTERIKDLIKKII